MSEQFTQHTQGDWEVLEEHNDAIDIGTRDVIIAAVFAGESLTAEDRANARLIAAAPELLRLLEEGMGYTYTNEEYMSRCQQLIDKVRKPPLDGDARDHD